MSLLRATGDGAEDAGVPDRTDQPGGPTTDDNDVVDILRFRIAPLFRVAALNSR